MALIKLGADPITSLAQDTKNARLCNAVFESLRNEVLEGHEWSFATKTVELASIVGTPIMNWTYQFQLPADFLKMIRAEDWKQEFETLDGYLHSNDDPMKIKYIWENTNSGTWHQSFCNSLSWRIAAELAYAITKSNTVANTMMVGYDMVLKVARYNDAHKKSPEGPIVDSFIDVRN
jgi:hypothetical protein